MAYNIRMVSTYPPRRCGIGTFSRDLANALEHFTGEVGYIRIAAIDKAQKVYHIPVDMVIDQYSPESWLDITKAILKRASESDNPTVAILQHEYGLDPDGNGNECQGRNYVEMAKTFSENGIITLVYLHTVLDTPDAHQRQTLQQLAQYSDGLVVTTESAVNILESKQYSIKHSKIKHIDHGIRMHAPSQYDRHQIKQSLGIEDRFLVTTLGLLSPGKGVEFGIRGYGKFINESLSPDQRKHILYLIAGQCHPEFVKEQNGEPYREYMDTLQKALDESGVRHKRVNKLDAEQIEDCDVVFLDDFLEESALLKLYGATNVMLLPYLNMQQISSGILADTIGSGRVAVTTKFRYAIELLHSNRACPEGIVVGRYARGILVDSGVPSADQIAEALDYIVFNPEKRLIMENQAHQRGYQMRWYNSAWALLQYIDYVREQKEIVTGRGYKFEREIESKLAENMKRKLSKKRGSGAVEKH